MSYSKSTDFLALLRNTPNGERVLRMPGMDYIIAALSRAGMFRVWVSQTPPTTNQTTTLWLRPALPSWSDEGQVFLWDATTNLYASATPDLWLALLTQARPTYVFQSVVSASAAIDEDTTLLAVQRNAPDLTTLTLPPLGVRDGVTLRIVDFSLSVVEHRIRLNPYEAGVTIMRRPFVDLYSTTEQLAGLSLTPSTDLNAWVIAP